MKTLNLNLLVLKVLALFFMVLDHSIILYPNYLWLRIIGRLSFPIYVYLLTIGLKKSKNLNAYILKLLFWGIISQPIYFLFWKKSLNILLAFSFYLLMQKWIENSNQKYKKKLLVITSLIISDNLKLDYGSYGITMFYSLQKLNIYSPIFILLISIIRSIIFPLQIFAVFALPIIFISKIKTYYLEVPAWIAKAQGWFFYAFYPIHLVLIFWLHSLPRG